MTKASLLFFFVCATIIIDETYGFGNYYWQNYADGHDLANFAPLSAAVVEPDCDNSKEGKKESSESSSSESSESSSESKEGGSSSSSSSEESKSSSDEGGEPNSKEVTKEGKVGSKEEKSSETSEEESKDKKKEVHKKKKSKESKSASHSRTYNFPSRPVQQIVYSAAAPYAYLPYRSSFVVQQPAASYPLKSSYQYVTLPNSAAIVNPYRPQVVSRIVSSPITRIIYSPAAVPAVSKAVVTPGSQVYSAPLSWSGPISYYKE